MNIRHDTKCHGPSIRNDDKMQDPPKAKNVNGKLTGAADVPFELFAPPGATVAKLIPSERVFEELLTRLARHQHKAVGLFSIFANTARDQLCFKVGKF